MQQIIQLKSDDDMASIRARIDTAELSHIVLVVPRDCAALATERGMRMLRRAADDAGAQVALVAHDEGMRERAELFGFPVFNSISHAQRGRWHMQSLPQDSVQSALNPPPPESVTRAAPNPRERVKQWRGPIVVIIAGVLLLCAAAFLVVPAANVHIVPSSVALAMTTDVSADPSLNFVSSELRAIPARRISREISGTAQLKTTTTKSLPDTRASGTVMFTNLRQEETVVPPGTVVKTSAGIPIRFTTVTTATIPAGVNNRVEAPIQAVDPGPTGNVKDLAINTVEGSLNLEVRVINLKPITSGNLKPVRVVTEDDKKKHSTLLMQQLTQQGN
ncbi:MAG: baseplate J/gp47 family protein, partial [Chloroflexota bacterium]|nr:baseplate J/gp47 family protein [Chloroflexota bacterium]